MVEENLLGVIGPDKEDERDYLLVTVQPEVVSLPDKFLLRDKMTSVQRQNYGTCVSHMSDGLKEFWDSQEYNKEIKLSQKFIYHNAKKISGLWNTQGEYLRNGLKSVCQYGACLETTYPDVRRDSWEEYVKEVPPPVAYKEAEKYKGKTYWRVGRTLDEFRQAIYQNKCPVGFGMGWYSSYYKIKSDGKLPLPSGKKYGGHAVIAVGWEENKLWVRNSWGEGFGDKGYFFIPFEEFNKHEIWDAWVLLDIIQKPEVLIGFVADAYLKSAFTKGELAWNRYALNLRTEPWGRVIKTLPKGTKLEILGEQKKTARYTWQKVKLIN